MSEKTVDKNMWNITETQEKNYIIEYLNTTPKQQLRKFSSHNYFKIIYVCEKSKTVFAGGKSYLLDNDSIALIPPSLSYKIENNKKPSENEFQIAFTYDFIKNISETLPENPLGIFSSEHPVFILNELQKKQAYMLLKEMYAEYSNGNPIHKDTNFILMLCRLLLICSDAFAKPPVFSNQTDKMQNIIAYINQNYSADISLDSLSGKFFMDKYEISRKFKKYTNSNLPQYLCKIRVRHAAELLKNTDFNITDISSFVGFNTPSHFSKLFRLEFGTAPQEYRTLCKNSLNDINVFPKLPQM